jgi:hypothetical protein
VEATVTVIPEHGQPRTESYRLITTLLDPRQAPAGQVAELYAERWESEIAYADLKPTCEATRKSYVPRTPTASHRNSMVC